MENQRVGRNDNAEVVHWFNHYRLLETIGYVPPAEAEANYWWQLANNAKRAA